ncbi:hypothetical protein ACXZ1K_13795 [Pedobacter sp. PWIIR3]
MLVQVAVFGQKKQPIDYVDPFIGTSNSRWMLFPGATMPNGMVKLSPDNQGNVWQGGYEYSVGSIHGFSHLHGWTMAGLLTMPTNGDLALKPGNPMTHLKVLVPVIIPDTDSRINMHHLVITLLYCSTQK